MGPLIGNGNVSEGVSFGQGDRISSNTEYWRTTIRVCARSEVMEIKDLIRFLVFRILLYRLCMHENHDIQQPLPSPSHFTKSSIILHL